MRTLTSPPPGRFRYPIILLRQMVITDFKLRYQGSVLGYFWSLLKPLALFSILYLVFVKFLKIGQGVPDFPVYLLLGIVVWSYFVEVTQQGVRAIVDRDELIRKINFPRYVIVLAAAVSSLVNLLLNLVVVGIFMIATHAHLGAGSVWVPLLILELFIVSSAVAFVLSALYVRFRDVIYIWEVFLQAAFYATPIIYPLSVGSGRFVVPERYAKLLVLNPMAQIIQDLRHALITPDTVTISTFYNPLVRLLPIGIVVGLAILALIYFRRRSAYFAEDV